MTSKHRSNAITPTRALFLFKAAEPYRILIYFIVTLGTDLLTYMQIKITSGMPVPKEKSYTDFRGLPSHF